MPPPPRNKALIRPYEGKPMVNSPLIRPYLLGGVALGGGPKIPLINVNPYSLESISPKLWKPWKPSYLEDGLPGLVSSDRITPIQKTP